MNIIKAIVFFFVINFSLTSSAEEILVPYKGAAWTTNSLVDQNEANHLKEAWRKVRFSPAMWQNRLSQILCSKTEIFWNITPNPGEWPTISNGEWWPENFIVQAEEIQKGQKFEVEIFIYANNDPAEIRLLGEFEGKVSVYARSMITLPVSQPAAAKNLDMVLNSWAKGTWKNFKLMYVLTQGHKEMRDELDRHICEDAPVTVYFLPKAKKMVNP
jgi:hypothetical protein